MVLCRVLVLLLFLWLVPLLWVVFLIRVVALVFMDPKSLRFCVGTCGVLLTAGLLGGRHVPAISELQNCNFTCGIPKILIPELKPFPSCAENNRTTLKPVDTIVVHCAPSFESPISMGEEHEVSYGVRSKVSKASLDHIAAYK